MFGPTWQARLLDFFLREVGPSVYNQATADAQSFFLEKASDLGAVRYEAEFDFWKKRRGVASRPVAPSARGAMSRSGDRPHGMPEVGR